MACYRPINIWNNTLHMNVHKPVQFTCACGECEGCMDTRRFDWYIRSYYSHLFATRHNGFTVFYTLTFDDEHVNRLFGKPAFDSTIFPKFIKRLRSYLSSHLPNYNFLYASFPEYGELYARPHYHTLFHLFCSDGSVPSSKSFYNAILSTWQQGFIHVKKGSSYGKLRSLSALRYATKYVTKSAMSYNFFLVNYHSIRTAYSQYLFDTFPDTPLSLRECYDLLRTDSSNTYLRPYYDLFREIRNKLTPSVHVSSNYGAFALDCLSQQNKDNETLKVFQNNKFEDVRMPLYLKRKLFYVRVPNERDGKCTKYVLSKFGLDHRVATLNSRINQLAETYASVLDSTISDSTFDFVRRKISVHFDTKQQLRDYLDFYRGELHRVAIYSLCYKGTCLNNDIASFDLFQEDVYKFHYYVTHSFTDSPSDLPLMESQDKHAFLNGMYHTQRVFELQHRLLSFLQLLRNCQLHDIQRSKFENSERIKKFNDLQKSLQ